MGYQVRRMTMCREGERKEIKTREREEKEMYKWIVLKINGMVGSVYLHTKSVEKDEE